MAAENSEDLLAAQAAPASTDQPTESNSPSNTQEATLPAAPALNREQRRAQAKGKKAGPTGANPISGNFNNRANANPRPGGAPIQNRLPRTGHK